LILGPASSHIAAGRLQIQSNQAWFDYFSSQIR